MATEIYTPLRQDESTMFDAAAGLPENTEAAGIGKQPRDKIAQQISQAIGVASMYRTQPAPGSCQQSLVLSFFFDGTGNNIDADSGTNQQSNVARLYEARVIDKPEDGIYSFYCYGIGTYFKEIDDPGGTPTGLGMGDRGQDRLDWAFTKFDERLHAAEMRARNPTNKILSIRVAVFGFSRGATLARAFARDLQARCILQNGRYHLRRGGYPVEVYFLGVFNTVASVGMPMSGNNTLLGTTMRWYQTETTVNWRAMSEQAGIRTLPFGEPGADPAPGDLHGHGSYARGLGIAPIVTRCLHLVAAHEFRNSFPLDSCLQGTHYAPGVTEMVYPGAHSDVGGGYQPGEGGRSAHQADMLSMVPLLVMHGEAVRHGVPLYGLHNLPPHVQASFAADEEGQPKLAELVSCFTHYMATAAPSGHVGEQVLTHMRQYYRWRFYTIARAQAAKRDGSNTPVEETVNSREPGFARERTRLEKAVKTREEALQAADRASRRAQQQVFQADQHRMRSGMPMDPFLERASREADERVTLARDAWLSAKAELDTHADDRMLLASIAAYDRRLMEDAQSIARELRRNPKLTLRPHYRNLLAAYEDEFVHGKGLRDEKLIAFFDRYVHDSLSGFARDATLPSDPRVLYVGGDLKMRYAMDASGMTKEAA